MATHIDPLGGYQNGGMVNRMNTVTVSTVGAANSITTATITAAPVGLFHYIKGISIQRTGGAAVVGTAVLAVTTTNIPGSLQWLVGNAIAIGQTLTDFQMNFDDPIKTTTAATATTIVAAAAGIGVQWTINVFYYTAP